jgi:hypothetical protein
VQSWRVNMAPKVNPKHGETLTSGSNRSLRSLGPRTAAP